LRRKIGLGSQNSGLIMDDFGEKVAEMALKAFEEHVPRKMRPRMGEEWTVLAAFLAEKDEKALRVISVATGSKCLSCLERSKDDSGYRLNDSHAEVLAKRALMKTLLTEMKGSVYVHNELINHYKSSLKVKIASYWREMPTYFDKRATFVYICSQVILPAAPRPSRTRRKCKSRRSKGRGWTSIELAPSR